MRLLFFFVFLSLGSMEALPRVPVAQVVSNNNGFSLAAYTVLAKGKERSNFVFSPYGLSASMAIAYLGSKEATTGAIAETLFYPLTPKFLGETFKRLNSDLSTDEGIGLPIALWIQKGLPLEDEFRKNVDQYYEGRFFEGDFQISTDSTRNDINKWVAEKTKKEIPFFMGVSDMPRGLKMLLVSTVTLNANWEVPFNSRATKTENFFSQQSSQRAVPMMSIEGEYPYFEDAKVKVIELPYLQIEGQTTRLGFWIALPNRIDGLKALEENLSISQFEEWKKDAVRKKVKVKVPRFRINEILKGEEVLGKMGLTLPFGKDADFSAMTSSSVEIGRMFQKVFISIDERGTRARKFIPSVAKPPETVQGNETAKEFTADHPFMFFVLDNTLGQILFAGHLFLP